jgi:hypothetical protein
MDVEKSEVSQIETVSETTDKQNDGSKTAGDVHLQLDKSGLPLVPQPSAHKDDPLVCET